MKTKPYDPELMNVKTEKLNRGLRATASIVEEAAVEPVDQPVEEAPKKETKVGIVANCEKLNLRRSPLKDSDGANIITELLSGVAVVIDEDESTPNFYKVTTETGLEGYCMKQFIELS